MRNDSVFCIPFFTVAKKRAAELFKELRKLAAGSEHQYENADIPFTRGPKSWCLIPNLVPRIHRGGEGGLTWAS